MAFYSATMVLVVDLDGVEFGLTNNSLSIDSQQLAALLQGAVADGSQINTITVHDLILVLNDINSDWQGLTVMQLVAQGTKVFDAVLLLGLENINDVNIVATPAEFVAPTDRQVVEALFVDYFCIMTQARHPADVVHVASIIENVIGISMTMTQVQDILASFNLNKMPKTYVKHINISQLGDEVTNRLGLGVAGYRLMSACQVINLKANAPADAKAAHAAIKASLARGVFWEFHPVFRSGDFVRAFGSLNKIISTMLAEHGIESEVQAAVENKSLFALPQVDARFRTYGRITAAALTAFETSNIFGAAAV